MATSAATVQHLWGATEYLWVAGGVILTLAIGLALLYWIDQEWRTLDQKRPRSDVPPVPPADNGPRDAPTDSP